ncbi:hypothetical protein [Hymenobacter sp. CRA2]|uniref:hypothetical protein n=1 Tax=Hymenobacter sp. CRA2 TaxID=1955620 RepID=UPI00098E96C9|nr:hypothetical protein [Hymenobacter sp. CRA2]OON68861.1 hypothetical protein B0919_11860 [Hymenobacter sp. CRA2]
MKELLTLRNLLYLLLSGLVVIGLGGFFKVTHLHPIIADGSLLLGLVCVLLAKVLLLTMSVRWALRVNRDAVAA